MNLNGIFNNAIQSQPELIAFNDPQYLKIRTDFFQMLEKAMAVFREMPKAKDAFLLLDWNAQRNIFNEVNDAIPFYKRISEWNPDLEETKKVKDLFVTTFKLLENPSANNAEEIFINFHMLFYILFNHTGKEISSTATLGAQSFIQKLFPKQVPVQPQISAYSSEEKDNLHLIHDRVQEPIMATWLRSEQTTDMEKNDIQFITDVSDLVNRLWPNGKILAVISQSPFDELQIMMGNVVSHDHAKQIQKLCNSLIRAQMEYADMVIQEDNKAPRNSLIKAQTEHFDRIKKDTEISFEESFKTLQGVLNQSMNLLS